MYQYDQLPEWINMGDDSDTDFVTPSISLAEQLKKKMSKSPGQGGLGGAMGGMLDMGGSAPMAGAMKGGMKSL